MFKNNVFKFPVLNQMSQSLEYNQQNNHSVSIESRKLLLSAISAAALVLTFCLSAVQSSFLSKSAMFVLIVAVYFAVCLFILKKKPEIRKESLTNAEHGADKQRVFTEEIDEKLKALEEADLLFSSTLKPADMFRLVSNRINELVPFSTSVLYLQNHAENKLTAAYSFGQNAADLLEFAADCQKGIAGKTFISEKIETDYVLRFEKDNLPAEVTEKFNSAAACPLKTETETYGVVVLYDAAEKEFSAKEKMILEAVGERIAPLFLNSIAFENNLNKSLNDAITLLPNERALFMMLENRVAESQRFKEMRELTVLAIDIKEFSELNKNYGHAGGDRILGFAAQRIKEQLRQMDFLSRISSDEFMAVLPTASDKITEVIIERIKSNFASNPFQLTPENKIYLELNFGAASFVKDGETAQDLIKTAKLRKHEYKLPGRGEILWFPQKYAN